MEVYEGVRGCPVASWAGVSGETRIITITIMSEGIGRKKKTKEEDERRRKIYLLINQSKRRNGIRCQNCIEKCQSHGSCPDDEVIYVDGSGRRCRCHLVGWMDGCR